MTDSERLLVDSAERDLDWPCCLNVRDLGGLPTADGLRIRRGVLIRADALNRLDETGVATVRAAGVGRIIDLRRQAETGVADHPFAGEEFYLNIPVQNPADPDHEWLHLAGIYCAMIDLRPDLFARAVTAFADAPEGAVVVHCAGGKDRTGMIVAFLLSLAGVPDDLIAADYALTGPRLAEDNRTVLAAIEDPRVREIAARLAPTPPEVMLETLQHVRERHGGVRAYLAAGGVPDDRLAAVRERLVGDPA